MMRSKGINGMVTPMRLEREAPLPNGAGIVPGLPKREPSSNVAVDVEQVVGQRPCNGLVQLVGVEHTSQ